MKIPKGLPGEFLLVLTIFIWIFFVMIYLSDRKNPMNRWCLISGILFSMGIFKEYLYFSLFPELGIDETFSLQLYSTLTAALYYLAMPGCIIFGLYFCKFHKIHPRFFLFSKHLIFLPAILLAVTYPILNTRYFQMNSAIYYYTVSGYNCSLGILFTMLIFYSLRRERLTVSYHQRKLVAIEVLIPLWYWLITVFLIHCLRLTQYFKAWQGEIIIFLFLIAFFLYNVFKDGNWGARLQFQNYNWEDNSKVIHKNAIYFTHTLKNELVKINWSVDNLQKKPGLEESMELKIILRSTYHLNEFMMRSNPYTQEIKIKKEEISVLPLLQEAVNKNKINNNIQFRIHCEADKKLDCDHIYILEVLNNTIQNSIDAIHSEHGVIEITYTINKRDKFSIINIKDNGTGIKKADLPHVFDAYNSSKDNKHHLGIGLFYCYNVMDQHQGSIRINSKLGVGTSIFLIFPYKLKA